MVKYYFFVVCGICFFINDTYSQNQKIVDSLNSVLVDKFGGERYPPLYQLAFEYIDTDNEKALEIIQQAEQAALLAGDSLWIVKSKRVKGQILSRLEKIGESINLCEAVLAIAYRNKFTEECAIIVNSLASSYLYHGQYDKALQYHFQTYELGKEVQDSSFIAMGLHNIGIDYYKLKDYKKGLHYLKRSLAIDKSMHDVKYYTLMNIGLCYANLNDFSNAQIYVEESLNVCRPNCSDKSMMHVKYTMGVISHGLKQYGKAENDFLASYSFSKKLNSIRLQFDNIYFLTEIYIGQNRINKAEYYLEEAEKLIRQGTPFTLEMLKIYSRFYELYSLLRNFKKVAYYQGKYIQFRDSIYSEALTTNLMKIESDFLERENIEKIAEQNEVLSLKEDIIVKQERLNLFAGMLALMLVILVIILVKSIRQKKLMNKILDQKVIVRTQELNENIHALKLDNQQRNLRVERSMTEIKSFLATLKGLSIIGLREIQDPKARFYIIEMGATSHQIAESLRVVYSNADQT